MEVIAKSAIEAGAARTVADVLMQRSTAFVRSYGAGGLASISLRGTTPSQTLVLLDGYRLSDPQLGQLDFSLLPSLLLDRVEILHGAGSALYGSDALGGVVHLRTGVDSPSLRLSGGVGAFGEKTMRGHAVALVDGLQWTAAADVALTDGDYPYLDRGFVPARSIQRNGWEARRHSLYGSVGANGWQVSAWYADAERGLGAQPGEEGADQWDKHIRLWGHHRQPFGWGMLRVGGLVQTAALRYRNSGIDLDDTGRTLLLTTDVQADVLATPNWMVSGGVSGGFVRATHPSLSEQADEQHAAVLLLGTGSYGTLLLYPALRFDAYFRDTPLTAFSPRLGANLRLRPNLHLKAQIATAFRAPTLNDRFWQPGGNPALRPENALAADLGLFMAKGSVGLELTVYVHALRDRITWVPNSGGFWTPENTSRVWTMGAEATYRQRWRFLEADVALALTDARDRSNVGTPTYGKQLRYVPRWLVRSSVGVDLALFRLDLSARSTGRRFVTADESQSLSPFFLLDAHLRYDFAFGPAALTLGAHLENAFDTEYAVVSGYPMPPRHARFYLLIEF